MTQTTVEHPDVTAFREANAKFLEAARKADAAFDRWFAKAQRGEPTNAAAATRLANLANYASADRAAAYYRAERALNPDRTTDIDPYDVCDVAKADRIY
jgi:hypothetical protein